MAELTEQEIIRRNKLEKYKELGIDPFGQRYNRTDTSETLKETYLGKTEEELE